MNIDMLTESTVLVDLICVSQQLEEIIETLGDGKDELVKAAEYAGAATLRNWLEEAKRLQAKIDEQIYG